MGVVLQAYRVVGLILLLLVVSQFKVRVHTDKNIINYIGWFLVIGIYRN